MSVGVVGAGITGLALTHYLRERDVDVVTYESRDRPGGVIRSRRVEGHVLEAGPQRVRLAGPLADLVDALGLGTELMTADPDLPLYVYARGRLRRVPRSVGAFVRTDLLSWRGKLRVLAEPVTASGEPDETAAAYFTRKFGREAYENLVGPLFGGIYGSDPAAMPARYALEGILALEAREGNLLRPVLRRALGRSETPPAVTFTGGMARLPEALYDAHRDRIQLSTPVESITADGDGYVLETGDDRDRVDEVVVTTPAEPAATLLADVATGAAGLADLRYNPLALVYLRADHGRAGLGYQVRRDEPLRTLGVSWNGSAFDRDGVHTCFLGGMDDPDVLAESDESIAETARTEFETVMACPARVLAVDRLDRGFPAYDSTWRALETLSLPADVHLATNYTARMGVPSRVREARSLANALRGD